MRLIHRVRPGGLLLLSGLLVACEDFEESGRDGGMIDAAVVGPTVPRTCEEAATRSSYVGCDYWPTVLANEVLPLFDYAVVVANAGTETANITVTGPNGVNRTATVMPDSLATIYLPWVDALKQGTITAGCAGVPFGSIKVARGAYHLVSTRPVSVYQFNALEYKSVGGPPGRDWTTPCAPGPFCNGGNCLSHSNDASLLLPSTAMTGNYRVAGQTAQSEGSYFTITGTQDGTTVTVKLGTAGKLVAGAGVPSAPAGGSVMLSLDAGDVAQLFAAKGDDLSGSLVRADKPIQVMTGSPCHTAPDGATFCDHLEESILPAEALGKHYFVTVPTGPNAVAVGHIVRLYGHIDGTHLTYAPATPPGAPATINAGDVVDLGKVGSDFEVKGDQAFIVGTLMLSASLSDPMGSRGDPSQSFPVAVEQYRDNYVFLSPDDYDVSFADVAAPQDASLTLDGMAVAGAPIPIGATGIVVHRLKLKSGAHRLRATKPVGIQVMGYGNATSYQFPGGGDYAHIAPLPK